MPMLPISARELASIREDTAAAACDQPCIIQRKTITPDAYGTATETRTTVAESMAGIAAPSAGMLLKYADRLGSLTTWRVNLPYGTDCQEEDYIIIAGNTLVAQVDLSPQSYNALSTFLACEVK